MRRMYVLFALAFASLAAATVAALVRPVRPPAQSSPPPSSVASDGALRMQAALERLYLPEDRNTTAYLQVDLSAAADPSARRRVPVNAVLILDRSGSMRGAKIERARDAARSLVQALGPEDRLAIVEFSSEARVLVSSTPVAAEARARALATIEAVEAGGGTNMSMAFDAAAPQLARGRAQGRADKVFLASDGQANEGIADRAGLLALARRDFAPATLSTFGIGDDYDEDLMSALAAQAGGRARYIDSPQMLAGAFRDELSRAASLVARGVRVRVAGLHGASLERMFGYEPEGDGWVRLPDFAAGEERRVLVKLAIPPGRGLADIAAVELAFEDVRGAQRGARTVAQATFTSDASLLALAPTDAAVAGARAEMAELAGQAARLQEDGRRDEAKARIEALSQIANDTARTVPASAPAFRQLSGQYQTGVSSIDARGDAASKKLKENLFDAARAPVAGW
jgi:Ca-activated chloride channel family protein